ncbi:serine-enriched protein-like isoform X2 [Lycorma delicatula]
MALTKKLPNSDVVSFMEKNGLLHGNFVLPPGVEPASNQHFTLIIEEFEPDVFRQLIEYIHTGCVTLQPRTLLGS